MTYPRLNQKVLARVIDVLERAAEDATMKSLSIGPFGEEGKKETEAVKEAMRLYMATWIEAPLRDCVAVLKGEIPSYRL